MRTLSDEYIQAAKNSYDKYKVLPSVQLAQGVLESAWFTKVTGKYNFFGVKALKDQPATIRWTHEMIEGKLVKVQQRFADYDSLQDSFDAHANLLSNPKGPYNKALPFLNEMEKFICVIAPIYATDKNYADSLINLIRIQGFDKYDPVGT